MLANPVTGKISLVQEIDNTIRERIAVNLDALGEILRKLVLLECLNKPSIIIEVPNRIMESMISLWATNNQLSIRCHEWTTEGTTKRQVEIVWWYQQGPKKPNYRVDLDGSFLLLNKS
jgi:hypothetical protein